MRGIFEAARGDFSQDGQFEMVRAKFEDGRGFPCVVSWFQPVGGVSHSILCVFRRCGQRVGGMVSAGKKRGQKCLPFPIQVFCRVIS